MTMIMFNDYDDDDDNYHCYNGNVLSITFFYTILEGLSKPNIEKLFYAMMKCCAQNSYACTTTYEFNAILAFRFVLKTLKLRNGLSSTVYIYFFHSIFQTQVHGTTVPSYITIEQTLFKSNLHFSQFTSTVLAQKYPHLIFDRGRSQVLHIKKKEHSLVMKSEKNLAKVFRLGFMADPNLV